MEKLQDKPVVVFYCQYVYGIGHFVRSVELASVLAKKFKVYILNGGEKIKDFEIPDYLNLIQLPAVYKKENENHLTSVDESLSLEECFALRKHLINDTLTNIKAHFLITEHFPFGLLFEHEALHLIQQVRNSNPLVKIVCSVRDVIDSSKGGLQDDKICNLLENYFHLVLVHGDENFIKLSDSFPKICKINVPIIQTGYVVNKIPHQPVDNTKPLILASIGGGRVGIELLHALFECHPELCKKTDHRLILFSGSFGNDFEHNKENDYQQVSSEIELYGFNRQKYLHFLSQASLVISLGGYNSVIEALSAKKHSIVYNRQFSEGNEEQNLRIQKFTEKGLITPVTKNDLKEEILIPLILAKLQHSNKLDIQINDDGAMNTLEILTNIIPL